MTIRRFLMILIAWTTLTAVHAQDAKAIYKEAKALCDAKNYAQAIPLLRVAAEKGHKKAQYRLGRCYDKGHGVKEDNKQAFLWYSKAATKGYAKAQYQLGRCYLKGKGTGADRKKAKTWLIKAVKNEKGGEEVLQTIKEKAAKGDEESKTILQLIR